MSRALIVSGEQSKFLESVRQSLGLNWRQLADQCGVDRRTVFNWRLELFSMPYDTLLWLGTLSGITLPVINEIIDEDDWHSRAGRLGAEVSLAKYGNPGTAEGRRAGGLAGYQKQSENPLYRE